ncbi:MAG: glycosyltransferase [Lachnospiraceae bacterium]
MEKKGNVVILLSSYNGAEYIEKQLYCLIMQDYVGKIQIVIRDDGSTDTTVDIIKKMRKELRDGRIDNFFSKFREITLLCGKNHGPQNSFLQLIRTAPDAGYYFFADQDDLWDRNYVSTAVNAMKEREKQNQEPMIHCCNYRLMEKGGKIVKLQAIEKKPHFSPLKMLFYNQVPGCCMSMNALLLEQLKKMNLRHVMMHDSFALSYACYAGRVLYTPVSYVSHRIHENNVVGVGHKKIELISWVRQKWELLQRKEPYDVSLMAREFIRVTNHAKYRGYYNDVLLLAHYKESRRKTWELLCHPDTKDVWYDRTTLSIRAKILLHLF